LARDASAVADPVLAELLEQHHATFSRALTSAVASALAVAWIMHSSMPAPILGAWLGIFGAVCVLRWVAGHSYGGRSLTQGQFRRQAWIAIGGHAAGGLSWGVLGAMALVLTPGEPQNVLAVFFIVAVFATFQAANPSRYEAAYYAWLCSAMVPIVVGAAIGPDGRYQALAILGSLFIVAISIVGRRSSQVMIDSIAKRQENARLLADLLAQKEALAEANRAKTRFFAAASHDLRQPMQAMVLLVESLQERVHEPAARRIVESIDSSVAAMSALMNELLDISRFDAGTVKVNRSAFPVARILERVRSNFAQAAAQKDLTLRVRPCAAVVEADPILLYRVLVNLVNNALRYTRSGGVLVGTRQRADGVVIEVWDTGVGIAKEDLKAIFREFHQLSNPQRDREQGLGLGLAIVERTCRLLELPILVRSRPGRGSVFSVRVPRGDPAKVLVVEHPRAADTLDGLRVLVIEDEKDIRAAMLALLEGWRCNVVAAGSAAAAESEVAQRGFTPDVVLADYRLPGNVTGLEAINRLRARFPDTVGVVISGDIAPEVLRAAEASGFHMMHKPLRPARLRALLGSVWRAHHQSAAAAEAT
jgi:two-component system, sensor histidine kinase